jgi:hypothetical protein
VLTYSPEGIQPMPRGVYWITLRVEGQAPMYHCSSTHTYAETWAAAWKDRGLLSVTVEFRWRF